MSPTHAEGARVTAAIRGALQEAKVLKEERAFAVWLPAHLTEAERGVADHYSAGDMLQFHQHAKGYKSGQRLEVGGQALPLTHAARFQVFRPAKLQLAAGDRIRITNNGRTRDGKHRLNNGALFTVRRFTPEGHIVTDTGRIIDREFGHLTHGYCLTSPAVQGKTVDKVFIGQSSMSHPASNQQQWYVSVSRGREQTVILTDDKQALLEAVQRSDERLSAIELARKQREQTQKHLSFQRQQADFHRLHEQRPRGETVASRRARAL